MVEDASAAFIAACPTVGMAAYAEGNFSYSTPVCNSTVASSYAASATGMAVSVRTGGDPILPLALAALRSCLA
jgi:hypothetical protein